MGILKLPTFGGVKVDVTVTTSTDGKLDGTAKARTARDRDVERSASRRDERDVDPKKLKKEQDEKNLKGAKKIKIGDDGRQEIRTVAEQQAKMIRAALDKQLNRSGKD